MQRAPYRSTAEKPEPPQEPKNEATALGTLRSMHASVRGWRHVLPAMAVIVILFLISEKL